MRQIVLDTETTGLSHEAGHRIIEIAAVELIDRKLTGNHFHYYVNPGREVDEGAFRVHGISTAFLKDKPKFSSIADDFIEFVKDSELIIHNATFDVGFINAEFRRLKLGQKIDDYCAICCSLQMARKKHPGQKSSLDALCKRYNVDNSNRQKHGALLDAEILALVYLAMTGGQTSLLDAFLLPTERGETTAIDKIDPLTSHSPVIAASAEELRAHQDFIALLKKKSDTTWEA